MIAPAPDRPWTSRYSDWGAFMDEAGLSHAVATQWPAVAVVPGDGPPIEVPEPYVTLDSVRLQRALLHEARERGVTILDDEVVRVDHGPRRSQVIGARGRISAQLVVDATGARAALTEAAGPPARAFQTAFGMLCEASRHPYPAHQMRLMDFRDAGDPPSFLYAMPMPDGRLFVEETSLVAAPALPLATLRARLLQRLARDGVRVERVVDEERCSIPMDPPLPRLDQRVVAIGAAAGAVHTATGYTLARAARTAPRLAEAIVSGLEEGPDAAARRAWRAVWPEQAVRARALHLTGAAVLQRLTSDELIRFFAAFFRIPDADRRAYLRGDAPPGRVAAAMWSTFRQLHLVERWRTIQAGASAVPALRPLFLP